jgi:hypothetical protein
MTRHHDVSQLTTAELEEMAVISTGPLTPMPLLAQTNIWMHQLLAAT